MAITETGDRADGPVWSQGLVGVRVAVHIQVQEQGQMRRYGSSKLNQIGSQLLLKWGEGQRIRK